MLCVCVVVLLGLDLLHVMSGVSPVPNPLHCPALISPLLAALQDRGLKAPPPNAATYNTLMQVQRHTRTVKTRAVAGRGGLTDMSLVLSFVFVLGVCECWGGGVGLVVVWVPASA